MLRRLNAVLVAILGLSFLQFAPGMISPASAASPLNVFVGYFDTHEFPFTANQPNPWPYKDPSSFDGTPCPKYPNDTTCWDAGVIRLDNPAGTDVTGVHGVVTVGSETYGLWGSSQTVKAHGTLVLTETGSAQNSENFDLSDEPPNSYNGGLTTSCVNSGAIPNLKITIGGTTTTYLDTGQVLNTGGVDIAHCLNGKFVSGRMDESHPWVQIGACFPGRAVRPALARRHRGQRLSEPDLGAACAITAGRPSPDTTSTGARARAASPRRRSRPMWRGQASPTPAW